MSLQVVCSLAVLGILRQAKFNICCFADQKEQVIVIDLPGRVCTAGAETMKIKDPKGFSP
jgi:hypothetical protein